MPLKKLGVILILIFSIIPIKNIFAQIPNVGFIPSNIWYSVDPFGEGDKIKIYTLLYNPDNRELSGTVIFFDSTTLLGQKSFKIAPKAVKDLSIDWTVTSGDHTIFAKIENAKFLNSNGSYEEVYLAENKTEESKRDVPKKIITELPNTIANKITESTTAISNIQKTIEDKTPTFVTKAIDSVENLRTNVDLSLEKNKESVQKELNILNNSNSVNKDLTEEELAAQTKIKDKLGDLQKSNNILKPFKYAELFFLSIFAFIFKYKILFYCILIFILFLILRFIWRLVF